VCAPGYGSATAGGTTCDLCSYNTFSSGGLAVGEVCIDCASGAVSGRGATENTQCYAALADPTNDVFVLSDDSKYVAAGVAPGCEATCAADDTCILLKIDAADNSCFMFSEDAAGTATVSFKVNSGVDFVRYKIPTGLMVGNPDIGTDAATTLAGCEAACKTLPNCEGIVMDGTVCKLMASELVAGVTGFYHVSGAKLDSNGLI
jgi:hypothetical protein